MQGYALLYEGVLWIYDLSLVWVISHYAIACFCIMPYHVVSHRISVSSISGLLAGILFTTTADLLHRQHLHLFILICV